MDAERIVVEAGCAAARSRHRAILICAIALLTASCSDCSSKLTAVGAGARDSGSAAPPFAEDARPPPLEDAAPHDAVAAETDGAQADAFAPDASRSDASPTDASPTDALLTDALLSDASPADAASACQNPTARTFTVLAIIGPDGIDTGLDPAGCRVSIQAFGRASYGYEGADCGGGMATTDPDGQRWINGTPCARKVDPSATMGTAAVGELIARSDPSASWTAVGSSYSSTWPQGQGGSLRLLYNDAPEGAQNDNSGLYVVTVSLGD